MTHAATQAEVEKALELASKATAGPWYWQGVIKHKTVGLLTEKYGHLRVMGFERWGMNEAAPVFRTEEGMKRVDELAVPRQSHRPDGEFLSINHPDAEFISASRELVPAMAERINRLRHKMNATICTLKGDYAGHPLDAETTREVAIALLESALADYRGTKEGE